MSDRDHGAIKELLAAYVLGALDEDEMREIRGHILACEECMTEADGHARAVDPLLAVDPVPLPDGFADRVLGIAREDRSDVVVAPRRRRPSRWPVALGFAAAAFVIGVLGFAFFDLRGDLDETRAQLAVSRGITHTLLDTAKGIALSGREDVVAKVIDADGGAVFIATGIAPAPSGRTYQLWFIKDGTPVSAGIFDGRADVDVLRIPESLSGVDAAAVTIERVGGVDAPTTEPIISSA